MNYYMSGFVPKDYFIIGEREKGNKPFEEVLPLIKEATYSEIEQVLFCEQLLSLAATKEERNIIVSITEEERKHSRSLSRMYYFYNARNITVPIKVAPKIPRDYISGIQKARFDEFDAIKRYREIKMGIPDRNYRDMIFQIQREEVEHIHKYDYILYINQKNKIQKDREEYTETIKVPEYKLRHENIEEKSKEYNALEKGIYRRTREFTLSELAQYNGSKGRPAFVAVNGIVYDVSTEAAWGGASHFGLIAGRDLSQKFKGCHDNEGALAKLPKVGLLKV